MAGFWEHGNGPLGSIKRKKLLGKLSDYYLLKKDLISEVNERNICSVKL
jgi:hypothetical protein